MALLLLLVTAGCSTRPQPENPYIPPSTQYSAGSTLSAAGGLMAASIGASFAQDPAASKTVKAAGTAAMGAGVGLMLASLVDAVEVQKERQKFMNLTRAFYHQYFGGPSLAEPEERGALPPLREIPFNFKEEIPADDDP